MDSLITAAARALAAGDPLGALNRVALREDAPALALRGIAMAQLGDLALARALLRRAAQRFAPKEVVARARCTVAAAEIALASRDLGFASAALEAARATLAAQGDAVNAAHAGLIAARRLLLLGRLAAAARELAMLDPGALPPALRAAYELAVAGIAMRRLTMAPARAALARAHAAAGAAGIAALLAEVDAAERLLAAPAARRIGPDGERLLTLAEAEELLAADGFIVDAIRHTVRLRHAVVPLAGRPVLFALVRALAEAWPGDAPRDKLLARVFRARQADESHRQRLRVEIGRLRSALRGLAHVGATRRGFALMPAAGRPVLVLARPVEEHHAAVLALLSDGESWSSSGLALAMGLSQRSLQRALDELARHGKVQALGRGRARRWMMPPLPGFATPLLLPAPLPGD
jgi:hypothetical protein